MKVGTENKKPSSKSLKYLDDLLIDCGFYSSLKQRNTYLSGETKRTINHLDDLWQHEVSAMIEKLKDQKVRSRSTRVPRAKDDNDFDPWNEHQSE